MFLEKAYKGRNNWTLYVLTLLIVFVAIQIASLPLALYLLIQNPEAAMQGNIGPLTSTNTGLALTLFTFAGGFVALFACIRFLQKKIIWTLSPVVRNLTGNAWVSERRYGVYSR